MTRQVQVNHIPFWQRITRLIGYIGMAFPIIGSIMAPSLMRSGMFALGCALLLIAAMGDRNPFYIAMQIVVLLGALMAFLSASQLVTAGVPIVAALVMILYFYQQGELKDGLTLFGCIGVFILSLGYAEAYAPIYLTAGLILAIQGYLLYARGVAVAMIWALLNTAFVLTTSWNLLQGHS